MNPYKLIDHQQIFDLQNVDESFENLNQNK